MSITAFITVVLLHLMVAISPGPAVLMSARIGVAAGARAGGALAAGIGVAAVVWAAAALFGLAVLFRYAPLLLTGLKLAGAAYLLYLALHLWRHATAPLEAPPGAGGARTLKGAFALGFLTQISNPKPAILFAAIFAGAVPAGTGWPVYAALLVAVFLNETLWNSFVSRMFSLDAVRRGYLYLKCWMDRVFGGILAVLGVKIAITS